MVITVIAPQGKAHDLGISLAKNIVFKEFKDKLLSGGYTFTGTKNFEFTVFERNNSTALNSELPIEDDKNEIKVLSD